MNVQKHLTKVGVLILVVASTIARAQQIPTDYHEIPKNYSEVRLKLFRAFDIDNTSLRTVGAFDQHINKVGRLNGELLKTMDKLGPMYDQAKTKSEAIGITKQIETAFLKRMNGIGRIVGPDLFKKFLAVTADLTRKLDAQSKRAVEQQTAAPKPQYSLYVLTFVKEENLALSQLNLTSDQKDQYAKLVRRQMPRLQATLTATTSTDRELMKQLTALLLERNTELERILGPQSYRTFRAILLEIRAPSK